MTLPACRRIGLWSLSAVLGLMIISAMPARAVTSECPSTDDGWTCTLRAECNGPTFCFPLFFCNWTTDMYRFELPQWLMTCTRGGDSVVCSECGDATMTGDCCFEYEDVPNCPTGGVCAP